MAFLEALAFLVERCGDLALGGAACEARDFFFLIFGRSQK